MINPSFNLRSAARQAVTVFLCAMIALVATRAADGDLDTTFGASGVRSVSFGGSDLVYNARLQPDGKMLVAGGVRPSGSEDFGVARFTADGEADATFGSAGSFSANLATNVSSTSDRATGVGVQSDGKIILAGYARTPSTSNDFTVIRLAADGTRDTSFNGGTGISMTDFVGAGDNAASMVVQGDDKIIVAGQTFSGTATLTMLRLNADGTTDTSFGDSGKVTLTIGTSQTTPAVMRIDASGKIVIGGITAGSPLAGSNYYAMLVRLNADGSRDTSFGTDGVLIFNTAGATSDTLTNLVLQDDGKIVACGQSYAGATNAWVARFTSSGSFDTTFNTTGIRLMDFGSNSDQLFGIALQSDGKVVAGGTYTNGSNLFDSVLVRLTSTGDLDTTFAGSGISKISLHANHDKIRGIGLQSSAKIVAALEVGATGSDDFGVARFLNTPSNTAPTISDVSDQATIQNVATHAIAFTVGDAETAAADLTLAGSSSNAALVSTSNIVFGGSGTNRTVTITPSAGQSGTSTITLTVTDQGGSSASDTFVLTVEADNVDPTVASIVRLTPANQTIGASTSSVVFRVTYSEAVTNVSSADFAVEAINGGDVAGEITDISGSGATRDVTVSITGGSGEFRLNVIGLP